MLGISIVEGKSRYRQGIFECRKPRHAPARQHEGAGQRACYATLGWVAQPTSSSSAMR